MYSAAGKQISRAIEICEIVREQVGDLYKDQHLEEIVHHYD